MPIVQVDADLSLDQLLQAVEQLSRPELEEFVPRVVAVRAKRQAPILSKTESTLLSQINQGLPADVQARYDYLIARREEEALSPDEYAELLRLTQQMEALQARRVGYLAELAQIRNISLTQLIDDLGVRTAD